MLFAATTYFDIVFRTDKRGQGFGFECSVSCSKENTNIFQITTPPAEAALPCECGLPTRAPRIVGGVNTESNEYPWQVSNSFNDMPAKSVAV